MPCFATGKLSVPGKCTVPLRKPQIPSRIKFGYILIRKGSLPGGQHRSDGGLCPLGEDCLHLNIWKADEKGTQKKPVMVWIHGCAYAIELSELFNHAEETLVTGREPD